MVKKSKTKAPEISRRSLPEGARGVLIQLNAEAHRALRILALDRNTSVQKLGIEAINMLFKEHGLRPVAENPWG